MAIKKLEASSLITKQSKGMQKATVAKSMAKSTNKDVVALIEKHLASRLAKVPLDVKRLLVIDYDPWVYDAEKFVYSPASIQLPSAPGPSLADKVRKVKDALLQKGIVKVGQLTFKVYGNDDWLKDRDSVSLYYELV